jgi:uncharacterized membrane protein YccC
MSNADANRSAAFWHSLMQLDRSKFNSNWMATRNALAVALPLGIGMALDNALGAVAITTGALNVSYSDGRDPYAQRARRMLAWSLLGAFAVFTGSVSGSTEWAAILAVAIWAFIAGMAISISTRAGDLGLNTLVALIVFGARGALSPSGAAIAAALVLGGGLLQTAFALLFWTWERHAPERDALGRIYLELARDIDPRTGPPSSTPLTAAPKPQLQEAVSALGREHSMEGERYRMLFDQSERIRLSAYALSRLHTELLHNVRQGKRSGDECAAAVLRMLELSSQLLEALGICFLKHECKGLENGLLRGAEEIVKGVQHYQTEASAGLEAEAAAAMDALAGQLRAVVALASHATPKGLEKFARQESSLSWRFQLRSWLGTLRANLYPGSPAFRHAVRLAICVPIADAVGRSFSWQRTYWIPMTVAIVLKPDFTTTFSRGVLRLGGTLVGLGLATALYHLLPQSALTQLCLVGIFTFVLRRFGPTNYGIFSIAISGLIVFLLAAIGVSPRQTVELRALNTAAGGILALIAYALWPTWERAQVSDVLADLIEATREYLAAIVRGFASGSAVSASSADEKRRAWRRARSNAEASVDRVAAEPGMPPEKADCLASILATLSGAAHAVMGLEVGLVQQRPGPMPPAFADYARDADFTLYFLAQALKGSRGAINALPKLRNDYRRMLEARAAFGPQSEFVLIETDRLTTAINTLREQVARYLGL